MLAFTQEVGARGSDGQGHPGLQRVQDHLGDTRPFLKNKTKKQKPTKQTTETKRLGLTTLCWRGTPRLKASFCFCLRVLLALTKVLPHLPFL